MAALQPTFGKWLLLLFTSTFSIQAGLAIMCWECNSHYDKNCGDPFRNETFAITDCNQRDLEHFPQQKATVCRKIIQKVTDDYRFVRGCGWLSNENVSHDCFKRAGTFNVLIQYCSCNYDGCNAAPHTIQQSSWIALMAMVIFSIWMTVK
ncbi:UPAR/Ly6 domain-containing protein crok [Parasteatoda tepidariorum]|uniref:UPAR/Ly6 domain-containing protein crok n=1 Tax=Parasteatoda tepidariorum TaxID=114398 RepID=UPI0039BCDA6D